MEECRNAFKILTGKRTGKRPLGWPRLIGICEYNVRKNLKEISDNKRNWIDSERDYIGEPL